MKPSKSSKDEVNPHYNFSHGIPFHQGRSCIPWYLVLLMVGIVSLIVGGLMWLIVGSDLVSFCLLVFGAMIIFAVLLTSSELHLMDAWPRGNGPGWLNFLEWFHWFH